MIHRYLKKPIPIEALQFTKENLPELVGWLVSKGVSFSIDMGLKENHSDATIKIQTLEGFESQPYGVWIAKGIKEEFYPIQDDVFKESYQQIEEKYSGINAEQVFSQRAR